MNQREWIEHLFQRDMAAFRAKHGLVNAVDTGPATREEIEAARAELGDPKTHEEWLEACRRAREGVKHAK